MKRSSLSLVQWVLGAIVVTSASCVLGGPVEVSHPVAPKIPLAAEPFSPAAVRLLDGPFKDSQDRHGSYLLSRSLTDSLRDSDLRQDWSPKPRTIRAGRTRSCRV
jgi:hypothetical protein